MSTPRNTFIPRFAVASVIGAGLVYLADANLNPYLLSIIQFIGLNIILAVSLNVTNGFIGLFSLGHPAFMTIGGYVTAILVIPAERKAALLPDLPPFWPRRNGRSCGPDRRRIGRGSGRADHRIPGSAPAWSLPGRRHPGPIFIVQSFAVNMRGVTRGALGLSGLPELTNLWWVYLFCLVTIYVCWQLKHSSLGRTMLAIRENELAAACLGVKVARMRILSFVLGAVLAGIAGGLWVHLGHPDQPELLLLHSRL